MAPAMSTCLSCMDEDEVVVFKCKGKGGTCSFQLCGACVKIAFDDSSGANSSFCPMCKTPSAIDMIASVVGQGAIAAVENKLRSKVEFQLKEQNLKMDLSRSNAKDMNDKARRLFNELAEKLLLKCPRCQAAFHDYDGCNALTCGVPTCRAAFCAICLEDCGRDAHQHVRDIHGDRLFDKSAFKEQRNLRAQTHIDILKDKLSHESFELKQLVLNHIEKAKVGEDLGHNSDDSVKKATFLQKTKASLLLATRSDRLALLSNPEDYGRNRIPISLDDISPRCAVPSTYRLTLTSTGGDLYRVTLEQDIIPPEGRWARIDDIEDHFKKNPKVESLLNVSQALRCAVIAIDGCADLYQSSRGDTPKGRREDDDEICLQLNAIDRNGNVKDLEVHHGGQIIILGLNQNKRMIMLEKHVQRTSDSDLMFGPLRHLIGVGQPRAIVTEIEMEMPDSQAVLNEEQKKVAHPLLMRSAMEVAGPPGTGKTKTIVELVRALLQCTSYDILLLSERNGAINAVAEKFKSESLSIQGSRREITDLQVWTSVMTYGAGDTMGDCTKLFTLEEKLKTHPELVELQEKRLLLIAASKNLSKSLRSALSDIVRGFGSQFDEAHAFIRGQEILKNKEDLSSPLSIISIVEAVISDIQGLLKQTKEQGSKYVSEESTTDIIVKHTALLGRLVPIRTDKERADNKNDWDAKEATKRLIYISDRLNEALEELIIFSPDNARDLYNERAAADEDYKAAFSRLEKELPALARLHMSTIGSSHRLPTNDNGSNNDSLANRLGQLVLEDDDDEASPPKDTICIFDESGCIPSYELLGLTRLGRPIVGLVLVGDKHQLPPYDPGQGRRSGRVRNTSEKIRSLLDASALTVDSGKVMLTTQYRVPKDVADILNHRVYRGQYNTCPDANVPLSGLHMKNISWSGHPRRKYVNPNEVEKGIALLRQLTLDYDISNTLVITPYKNQQREFQYQIERQGCTFKTTVLTIDQCQGQEADAVILSLVQRPTRFLTMNRFNVALSRVRKKLYILTDFQDLKDACRNSEWECAHLASDLLIDST